jgi:hypothetical protein
MRRATTSNINQPTITITIVIPIPIAITAITAIVYRLAPTLTLAHRPSSSKDNHTQRFWTVSTRAAKLVML